MIDTLVGMSGTAYLFCDSQTTESFECHRPQNTLYFQIRDKVLTAPHVEVISFSIYILFLHCLIFVRMWAHIYSGMHVEFRGQHIGLRTLLLSPWAWHGTQVISLCSRCLYPLSHLSGYAFCILETEKVALETKSPQYVTY